MNAIPEDTLTKSISAGQWALANTAAQRLFVFGTFFIVARILTPADFGLIAIIAIIPTFLDGSTALAFDTAAFQKGNLERYLDVIWTFTILRGFAIFALVYFAAPLAAAFFHVEYALTLLRFAALGVLIQSFGNIGQTYFFKDFDFRSVFLRDLTFKASYALATIVLALLLHSYWALFWGGIFSFISVVAITYVLHPYRPRFDFRFRLLGELRSFSQWLYAQEMIQQLSGTVQDSLLGHFTTPAGLALFSKAQSLADAPTAPLISTINKVSFTSYVTVRDSSAHVLEGVNKTFEVLVSLAFPYLVLILLSGTTVVHIALGYQWLAMAPYLKILAVEATLDVLINTLAGPVFNAIGKPHIQFVNSGIRSLTLILAMTILVPIYGIWGAVFAALISVAVTACVVIYHVLTNLHLHLGRIAESIAVVAFACLVPIPLASYLLTLPFSNTLFGYMLMTLLCGALYASVIIILGRKFGRGPYKTLELIVLSFLNEKLSRRLDFLFVPKTIA